MMFKCWSNFYFTETVGFVFKKGVAGIFNKFINHANIRENSLLSKCNILHGDNKAVNAMNDINT